LALQEPTSDIRSEFNISKDFIETDKKLKHNTERKKGGPYTKQEIMDRKNQVYRLHFEYGYSARRIADLLKVNRNTVNRDIQYWYTKLARDWEENTTTTGWFMKQFNRFDVQRNRLLLYRHNTPCDKTKLSLERLILEIDSRILQFLIRLKSSQ